MLADRGFLTVGLALWLSGSSARRGGVPSRRLEVFSLSPSAPLPGRLGGQPSTCGTSLPPRPERLSKPSRKRRPVLAVLEISAPAPFMSLMLATARRLFRVLSEAPRRLSWARRRWCGRNLQKIRPSRRPSMKDAAEVGIARSRMACTPRLWLTAPRSGTSFA